MPPLRVLLVDDSAEFLNSVTGWLSMQSAMILVGCVQSASEALDQIEKLRPDLVLMDLAMPDMSGLEATRHLKARAAPPKVVIFTLHDEAHYRAAAQAVGADGFIGKSDFVLQIQSVIQELSPNWSKQG